MPYYYPLRNIKDEKVRLRTIDKLLLLRQQLDTQIPQRTVSETLLLATWNIREFGGNRMPESLHYIAEIVSRFDLVAIQEVSADLKGLEKLVSLLDPHWDYIVTDSTDGAAGGGERMAFLYDKSKISFKKLAGEIVLPSGKLIDGRLQFARTPYCVAFQAGWFKFNLTTVHIYYGKAGDDPQRYEEINTVANYLAKRSGKEGTSYILLGDFNIEETKDRTMKALEENGFIIPEAIKEHPSNLGKNKHYDQIAFHLKLDPQMTIFSEREQKSGAFDFTESIFTQKDLKEYQVYFDEKNTRDKTEVEIERYYMNKWRTFQISDHLPLWVELKIDFSNQYLKKIKE